MGMDAEEATGNVLYNAWRCEQEELILKMKKFRYRGVGWLPKSPLGNGRPEI